MMNDELKAACFFKFITHHSSLVFKVHGGDVLADGATELDDGLMVGVCVVGCEPGAVLEGRDETGVVRARKAEDVSADGEGLNLGDTADERAQTLDMFTALLGADLRFVLPDDDVRQHSL
jgi:hypothetical protein